MPRRSSLFVPLHILAACLVVAVAILASPKARAVEAVGGSFALTKHTGELLSDKDLLGRPYALFFGFTYCPDVCPTALFELAQVLETLGPDGDGITPLFVTVDPARDTADTLQKYLGHFDTRIIGLRGTEEETAAVAKAFRATYRKVDTGSGSYTMDHTAVVYLVDGKGRFFDTVDYRAPLDAQVAKYRAVIRAR